MKIRNAGRGRVMIGVATCVCALAAAGGARAAAPQNSCGESTTRKIPARAPTALGGRALDQQLRGLGSDQRESRIRQELLSGNIPAFLRRFAPVRLLEPIAGAAPVTIVICVAPDYLAIGSDDDFILIPMRLATALSVANRYGMTLPTPRIVDAIYAQAVAHFIPQPLPAGDAMRSMDYYWRHNDLVETQRAALDFPLGTLSAGDKKDLVLTKRLWSHLDRVAIYGWQRADGKPIQPLSTVHGWHYADYSHGVRLISTRIFVDGMPTSIFEALRDPRLARVLSREGMIANAAKLIADLRAEARPAMAALLPQLHSGLR